MYNYCKTVYLFLEKKKKPQPNSNTLFWGVQNFADPIVKSIIKLSPQKTEF